MTYREARMETARRLKAAGIENESAESLFLLEAACGCNRNDYLLRQTEQMPESEFQSYQNLTARRCERIPLQHLTGTQEFMGLPFRVNENVLIPRQDTELLVEEAVRTIRNLRTDQMHAHRSSAYRVLDMCTGSGCIAVSMKHYCPEIDMTASDISEAAMKVAVENADANRAEVRFIRSNLFENITGMFDTILSNPPYIPSDVIPTLMPEVRDHEPRIALDGSPDGLVFYREIIRRTDAHLSPDGWLMMEIGYDQGAAVAEQMREHYFYDIEIIPDLAGLDRVVKGRKR